MPESTSEQQAAAACGVLKFHSDDWMRWHFESRENPAISHTVDLSDWDCSGSCSCPHFDFRIRPLLEKGTIKPHEDRAKCRHIRRAEKILCYRTKKELLRQRNLRPNPNPIPNAMHETPTSDTAPFQ